MNWEANMERKSRFGRKQIFRIKSRGVYELQRDNLYVAHRAMELVTLDKNHA